MPYVWGLAQLAGGIKTALSPKAKIQKPNGDRV